MGRRNYHHMNRRHKFRNHNFRPKYSLFQRISYFSHKHPITIGVILIIIGFVFMRLSFTKPIVDNFEFSLWTIIISICFFIGGILVLKGYWRNNVVNFNTKHQISWNNR